MESEDDVGGQMGDEWQTRPSLYISTNDTT